MEMDKTPFCVLFAFFLVGWRPSPLGWRFVLGQHGPHAVKKFAAHGGNL